MFHAPYMVSYTKHDIRWNNVHLTVEGKTVTLECRSSIVVQWLTNLTRNNEVVGLIPALAQCVDDLALP